MMFTDRSDAGKQLIPELVQYRNHPDAIVIGLPRGGVVNAFEVAKGLNLPLDIVCPRKIGAPYNPEFAIGAITETGEGIIDQNLIRRLGVSQEFLDEAIESEKQEAQHRLATYRKGRLPLDLTGKIAIIVDDGLATGSTMKAAIRSVKAQNVAKIVVAVPVSPPDTRDEIRSQVDEIVCLDTPPFFQAVGQFYQNFAPTEDEEVIALLDQAASRNDEQ